MAGIYLEPCLQGTAQESVLGSRARLNDFLTNQIIKAAFYPAYSRIILKNPTKTERLVNIHPVGEFCQVNFA